MKLDEKTQKIIKWAVYGAICAIGVAFLVIIGLRKFIFNPDGYICHMYTENEDSSALAVKIVKSIVIIDACLLASQAGNWVAVLGTKVNNSKLKTGLLLFGSVVKYLSVILIILLGLAAWGVDTTAIVTGAGVLTLVISLGCQSLVSDIVAGIFMLFEGDIVVGDVVVVNGWRGTVLQIGLRRTKIEDTVGNINIVNNSSISNIINNTRDLSVAVCEVGIEYGESILKVEHIISENIERMKKNIPSIVKGPFYKGVQSLGNSAVIIKLVAQCKEDDIYQCQRDLNREIKLVFDENNINIPFDQIVLNYREKDVKDSGLSEAQVKSTEKFVKKQKELSKGIEEQE